MLIGASPGEKQTSYISVSGGNDDRERYQSYGYYTPKRGASLVAQLVKNPAAMQETPHSIPGLGRSPGEGIGYPLQYSWASLMAQMVKNLPAMWETWVRSLSWEDCPEEDTATYSSILAWRIPMDRGAGQAI